MTERDDHDPDSPETSPDGGQEPAQFVCAQCGIPLDHQSDTGYVHPLGDAKAGHAAVPVPRSEALVVAEKCDFCFAPGPEWLVPASAFEVAPGHMSGTDWTACNECAALIEGDRWTGLLRRAKMSWEGRHGPMPAEVERGLSRMYRLLRKHITGSLKPNPAVVAGSSAARFGQGWKTIPSN